ncbi:MAG TPA: aminotransferase class V-fold PLP-dependent enzyme [Dermatophilaceae bacterium]|nr:aminotransferase class V-fold PLP-dependent enzyme [Dermatophilaceae bacterium]
MRAADSSTRPAVGVAAAGIWGDESHAAADAVALAGRRISRPSDPKSTARPASELAAAAGPTVTPAGIGADAALRVFEEVIAPATRAQDDPHNLAYIPAAPTRAALAFDAVVSSHNIFAGTWEAGAGAVFAENQALAWLVGLLGWPASAGGCFVSGGTLGNLSALVAGRQAARARRGGPAGGRWQLACSADAHSSIVSAASVMDADVVVVEEDDRGHLTGPALRGALQRHPDVFAVVASAGTTNAGIIDDLADVAEVCEDFDVWLHVDGAYGGAALAAPSARARFAGIERADSFIVDPHKWLFAPYDCCALLYRDPEVARAAHSQHASYLDRIDREAWNPADLAVHLSRRARGLPFWFSLAVHGTDRYAAAVEQTLATAAAVADHIRASPTLRLVQEPELSVLLFERPGWSEADYHAWSDRLAHAGQMLCLPTRWRGRTVLRLAFVNPATQAGRVNEMLSSTT